MENILFMNNEYFIFFDELKNKRKQFFLNF